MASSDRRLTAIQSGLLDAFFERNRSFFLSGGAALAGFHLHHRDTKDLDFFGTPDADAHEGASALRSAAASIGAGARILQESGDFRRFVVERGDETTLVDIVIDRVPQLVATKETVGRICIDPMREIAANKLCAILDRTEVRDLVDLRLLLARGFQLEGILADAQRKHAGADPATLAWMLSLARIPPGFPPVGDVTAAEIEAFRVDLTARLRRLAAPEG